MTKLIMSFFDIEVDLDNIRLTKKGLDFANQVFEKFV